MPLPDPSKPGFAKSGKGSDTFRASSRVRAMMKGAVGTPCWSQDLLRPALVQAEREGERVGGVVRDAEELADGRDVSLAVGAVEPLGDVEHEVGPGGTELLREALVRLEKHHLSHGGERRGDRVDGALLIPLGIEIGLLQVVAQHTLRRGNCGDVLVVLGDYGGGRVRPGDWCRCLRLEIEG